MAGAALLGLGVAALVFVVVAAQILLRNRHRLADGRQVQHHVLDLGLFGQPEARFLCLEEGLHLFSGGLYLGLVGLGVEPDPVDLATLQQGVQRHRGGCLGHDGTSHGSRQHLPHGQVHAQLLCKAFGRQTLRSEDVTVDAAIGVAQTGELRVRAEQSGQPIVRWQQLIARGGRHENAVAHDALQRLLFHLWRIEHLRVNAGHLLAHPLDGPLVGLIPLTPGDGASVHLGHGNGRLFAEPGVALHPEEDEGREDQQHQHELEHFLV